MKIPLDRVAAVNLAARRACERPRACHAGNTAPTLPSFVVSSIARATRRSSGRLGERRPNRFRTRRWNLSRQQVRFKWKPSCILALLRESHEYIRVHRCTCTLARLCVASHTHARARVVPPARFRTPYVHIRALIYLL